MANPWSKISILNKSDWFEFLAAYLLKYNARTASSLHLKDWDVKQLALHACNAAQFLVFAAGVHLGRINEHLIHSSYYSCFTIVNSAQFYTQTMVSFMVKLLIRRFLINICLQ